MQLQSVVTKIHFTRRRDKGNPTHFYDSTQGFESFHPVENQCGRIKNSNHENVWKSF